MLPKISCDLNLDFKINIARLIKTKNLNLIFSQNPETLQKSGYYWLCSKMTTYHPLHAYHSIQHYSFTPLIIYLYSHRCLGADWHGSYTKSTSSSTTTKHTIHQWMKKGRSVLLNCSTCWSRNWTINLTCDLLYYLLVLNFCPWSFYCYINTLSHYNNLF